MGSADPLACATMCYMKPRRLPSAVGVRELRQNLSVYLDRVKRGESLTVTEHGTAVAMLRPLAPAPDLLSRLVAEGRATPPTRSLSARPQPLRRMPGTSLADVLDELRDDRV